VTAILKTQNPHLHLETLGPSAATSALELPALALDVRLLVRVGTEAEVLDGLTGVLGTAEEDGVGTSGGTHSELIDGEALTTGGQDAGTGGCGEAKGCNGHLGEGQETVVVGDGGNNDNGLALDLLGSVLAGGGSNNAGDGHRRAVDLAHHQAAEDDLVELGVGTAAQESVELDEKSRVWVVRLGRLAVARSDVVLVQVNTHFCCSTGWC